MSSGFTLIELLIVIALLGALAIGLLATVDPFEQLKKGTDTSRRNTTAEVYNAMIRYYSVKSKFPWGDNTTLSTDLVGISSYVDMVIGAGELKSDFLTLAGTDNAAKINIYSISDTDTGKNTNIVACFSPESKSFQKQENTKYDMNGNETTGCKSQTDSGGNDCWWCVK